MAKCKQRKVGGRVADSTLSPSSCAKRGFIAAHGRHSRSGKLACFLRVSDMVDAAMAMTANAIHKRGVGHSIAACSMLAARLENIAVGIVADGCIFFEDVDSTFTNVCRRSRREWRIHTENARSRRQTRLRGARGGRRLRCAQPSRVASTAGAGAQG